MSSSYEAISIISFRKKSLLFFALSFLTFGIFLSTRANAITSAQCEARVNDTPSKLIECIQTDPLWQHMINFQNISDANPDSTFDSFPGAPHGSRDSGTPGDIASVKYIADKMTHAGYNVSVQPYPVLYSADRILPVFTEVTPLSQSYVPGTDFNTMIFSGTGEVTGQLQAVGGIIIPPTPTPTSTSGCTAADFAGFVPGRIALIQRGTCSFQIKAQNALTAGATGVIIFNEGNPTRITIFNGTLESPQALPVISIPFDLGSQLVTQANAGAVQVHLKANVLTETRTTYNVIADSKGGNPNSVLVVDAHYDSIYGAGMLDNASGSATILEIALKMQKVNPVNKVRFIWFGGEELGLFGSKFYIDNLSSDDLSHINYVMDADVTASPNYIIGVNDPAKNSDAALMPNNTFKASLIGYNQIVSYLDSVGLPHVSTTSNGTDSHSFNIVGIPGSGILTGQDCCKSQERVNIFGGFVGNYEGNIPSFDGGCVDNPYKFCDNLTNNDAYVLTFMSKAFANSVIQLAFDNKLKSSSGSANIKPKFPIANEVGRHFNAM